MNDLISPFQNAFVKGRVISDNVILTGELLHHLKKQKKTKNYWGAFKVDYFKAFDKISWDFLLRVLKNMNFPDKWLQLIHQCISTTNFHILINGAATKSFSPNCGLRQGDPLSPYLFLLCLNVFSHHLTNLQLTKKISGVKIAKLQGPKVNHLLFADDCVLFFKANMETCNIVNNLLLRFASISGLKVNTNKSQVYFSPNTPPRFRKLMSKILKCPYSDTIGLYLGNTLDGENMKINSFKHLQSALSNKLQGWKGRFLSQAGRVTLIKSTLASISTYYLSHMHLTKTQAGKCDSIINNFLWGGDGNKRKIHTLSWATICTPMKDGGLGIRNMFELNQALLAKHVWKIINNKDSLLGQTMLAKYGSSDEIDGFKCPSNSSTI